MTTWTLVRRGLRFHARAHLGVLLGATVGSAALTGALLVGDSVRVSLRDLALLRLGRVQSALVANDRFFRSALAEEFGSNPAPVLQLPGTAGTDNGGARANHVQVLGVADAFWQLAGNGSNAPPLPPDCVLFNEYLARQLVVQPGDTVVVRVQKPSLLSLDAPLTPQENSSVAMRLRVAGIVADDQLGRFSLRANQIPPFNAFVRLDSLQQAIGQSGRANLLLLGPDAGTNDPNAALRAHWRLADGGLELRRVPGTNELELISDRVFLDPPIVAAAKEIVSNLNPILTYFVNDLRVGERSTPYSMVTAMGEPVVPPDMRDDEILINDWLANDLQAKPGDLLRLSYFVMGPGRALEQRTNEFRVRAIVPMAGVAADRTLMPEFPGLAKAESSSDWDAGFPIDLGRIRPKDEQYWRAHRGTPKAFVTLAAGQRMWTNRFGDVTALRFPADGIDAKTFTDRLLRALDPASVGLAFQPVREQALAASSQSMDFGGLFIGFSFFLIAAALLLMALLFQFGLERRATEIGTLLALGFRPRQVRRLLLGEGVALALMGGVLGAAAGTIYARAMLRGLTSVWRNAVGTSALRYHSTPATLATGICAGGIVAAISIWLALRKQAGRPARELLAQGADLELFAMDGKRQRRSRGFWIGCGATVVALGMVGAALLRHDTTSAETFFSAGALLLVGGLGFAAAVLGRVGSGARGAGPASTELTLAGLGLRGTARRRKRSLATIGLLACGAFLILAVGAFRLDARQDSAKRSSGTGGFALLGESTLPVSYDLNGPAGRDFYGLDATALAGVSVVSFRVHDGDDASCLNLNRAQSPRLLGVSPEALQQRHAFTFAEVAKGLSADKGWLLLKRDPSVGGSPDEIPAIGDENSILWALGKKVGDTIDYTDEQGRPFRLRLVAAVANSILQGSLVIDESEFVSRFPGVSGYRMFLVDAPPDSAAKVSSELTRGLRDAGLELTPAADRLNAFNAVQNTYLSTFQALGGLGLLLGSAGLGVVVLRNVQDRRGELGLLLAVGFRRRALHGLVLSEHAALLGAGLVVGAFAAAVAVLPSLLAPGAQLPGASLAITVAAVFLNGLLWAWLATRFALRGNLLDALRNS
jgi:putative ABC transport system permease protein